MYGKTLRIMAVLTLAIALAIGASIVPQAQQKPYVVCSDIPWDPFEMVTAGGEYFGFDLDVMRAIAAIEGYQIKIQNLAFDSIIPALGAGQCDIGASGFTITAEREQAVDFSNPYWLSNQAVIVRQDSGYASLDDVFCCGHKIGAQRGTTGADWVQGQIDQGVDVE
ncbi:MAG: transporter substrate-binding domain-containing protein, partial [Candidatus Bipolaricaulia bacterium]